MQTKEAYATRALRSAMTKAANHLTVGNVKLAIACLRAGAKTAEKWMDETHPAFATHVAPFVKKAAAKAGKNAS